jgi:hypothetical protein
MLDCDRESARGGYARVAALTHGETLLALGAAVTLFDALAALEDDYLRGGPTAAEFQAEHCPTCAMNLLDPPGSSEAVSALDAHLLDGHRFEVEWAGEQFRLVSAWRRDARVPRELMRELIAAGAPTRWRHGEYVWDVVPGRSRKTGEWTFADYKSISRPAGSKDIYPVERRRVEAVGSSLAGVLTAAEDVVAAARRDDEQWQRRTLRCT